VERSFAWLNGFQSLRIRWLRSERNFLTELSLGCALIALRAAGVLGQLVSNCTYRQIEFSSYTITLEVNADIMFQLTHKSILASGSASLLAYRCANVGFWSLEPSRLPQSIQNRSDFGLKAVIT
jgi:hypothetical protein